MLYADYSMVLELLNIKRLVQVIKLTLMLRILVANVFPKASFPTAVFIGISLNTVHFLKDLLHVKWKFLKVGSSTVFFTSMLLHRRIFIGKLIFGLLLDMMEVY